MYKDGFSPLPVCGVSLAVTSTKPVVALFVLWFYIQATDGSLNHLAR